MMLTLAPRRDTRRSPQNVAAQAPGRVLDDRGPTPVPVVYEGLGDPFLVVEHQVGPVRSALPQRTQYLDGDVRVPQFVNARIAVQLVQSATWLAEQHVLVEQHGPQIVRSDRTP